MGNAGVLDPPTSQFSEAIEVEFSRNLDDSKYLQKRPAFSAGILNIMQSGTTSFPTTTTKMINPIYPL